MKTVEFRTDKRFIRRARELKTIVAMVQLYCRAHHRAIQGVCGECGILLDYARRRLETCPFGDAKPVCNKCLVHCYSVDRREQVRLVMRWAGPRMLRHHPLMAIRHLLDSRRPTPRLPEKKTRAKTRHDARGTMRKTAAESITGGAESATKRPTTAQAE